MKLLISTLLLVLTTFAEADVYKWIAPDGSLVYTDRPLNGAMRLPVPAWYPPPPPPPATPVLGRPAVHARPRAYTDYTGISVEKPRAGQYVREQGEGIEVAVKVKPRLHVKRGHRIQLSLDGETRDASPATTQTITDVERGPHSVAAQILAPDGRVLIHSRPVNFFYQRPSHAFAAPAFVPTTRHPVRAAPKAPRAPIFPRAPNVPAMRIAPSPPRP